MNQEQRQTSLPGSGDHVGEGLSWTWHLDLEALTAALSEPAPWNRTRLSAFRPAAPPANPGTNPRRNSPTTGQPAGPPPSQTRPPSTQPDDTAPGGTTPGASSTGDTTASRVASSGSTTLPATAAPAGEMAGAGPPRVPPPDADSSLDPVEADFAEYLDAIDAGRSSVVPLSVAAGRVAEMLAPSPDLAAWLACNPAGHLEDGALAGAAAGYRRLAAWAQAGELAVVAQMASRSAAADSKTGTGQDGRPDKVPADAYGQVSLALTMSQAGPNGGRTWLSTCNGASPPPASRSATVSSIWPAPRPLPKPPRHWTRPRPAPSRPRSCPGPGSRPPANSGPHCAAR